jgi:uncharacterized protein YbgA (DUF1722 family)/uncharacterized protein YbbK (DUF523 family)
MGTLDEQLWKGWHDDAEPVRLGVSACLLGAEVRFDSGHKRDRYLTDVLGENVEWVPVCPELEMGLGIPRPVLQLRGGERGDELTVRSSDQDLTEAMRAWAEPRVAELREMGLDGFVLKKDSPSCGMERVRVYPGKDMPAQRTGVGHFARQLMRWIPDLPLEEEGRLNDPPLREAFIEAIFCHNRWRVLERRGLTRRKLVAFHEAHKMLLMAHEEKGARALGRVVASLGQQPDEVVFDAYRAGFIRVIRERATVARHINVLEHLFGHVKRKLSSREKREIEAAIEDYRARRVPLIVPMTLLRFLVTAHEVDYVRRQLYLEPHPRELMLRNHV